MNKLFLHHRYIDFPPRDVSGTGNDGVAHAVTRADAHAAAFDGSASWIEVPQSPSMDDLVQFRAHVTFRLDAAAPAVRMNLVEGFVSFAVVVEGDRSVALSIVDRAGNWNVCASPPGVVPLDTWQTLGVAHDGVSEARVTLGSDLVARKVGVLGPVRSVGPLGIAIGRWPDAPAYQLHGQVSEVALYKFDPEPETNLVFGAPCVDGEALERLLRELVSRMGEEQMRAWAESFQLLVADTSDSILRGHDDTDAYRARLAEVVAALAGRDSDTFRERFGELAERARGAMGDDELESLKARFEALRDSLPLTEDELRELARALCLDDLWRA